MNNYVFAKTSGEILLIKGYKSEKCIIKQALKLAKKYDCKINVYALSSHISNYTIDTIPGYYAEGDKVYADYDPFADVDYLPAEKYDIEIGGDFDCD